MSTPVSTWHTFDGADRRARRPPERALDLYGYLLGPLIAGYLLFDKAFAYIHVPGSPLYISEMVLGVGVVGVLGATRYLRIPLRDEPILAVLAAFGLWGAIRTVPGFAEYGIDALRDSALWYYTMFAFLAVAATTRSMELPDSLRAQLVRLTPWLLAWLPIALILVPVSESAPSMPFSTVSILSHKPGNGAVAAILVLGVMWLFPQTRSARNRAAWSIVALLVIALVATQNRGGLLGALAGAAVGLAFLRDRMRVATKAVAVIALGLTFATVLQIKVPFPGLQGREFSASQLVTNVASVGDADSPGNLDGTVQGRRELWSRVIDKQIAAGRLIDGSGFGPNLATEVGVYDDGTDRLRSPHNSHLDVLARMGVVGLALWVWLWVGWYCRLISGCRRLARRAQYASRQTAVLCMMVASTVLVSTFFDPQLEGPQIAVLLWTTFGIGVSVTSRKACRAASGPTVSTSCEPHRGCSP